MTQTRAAAGRAKCVMRALLRAAIMALVIGTLALLLSPWRGASNHELRTTPRLQSGLPPLMSSNGQPSPRTPLPPPPSLPMPVLARAEGLLAEAVSWSAAAIASAPIAPDTDAPATSKNWNFASELITSLQAADAPSSGEVPPSASSRSTSVEPPPPLLASSGRAAPPQEKCDPASAAAAAAAGDDTCLFKLARTVGVWDGETGRFVTPERAQMPPRRQVDSRRRAAKGVPSASSILAAMQAAASATEPPRDESLQEADARNELSDFIRRGTGVDAEAERQLQYAKHILAPRTRASASRECWSADRCAGRSGPCAWCGARLCCRANHSSGSALCRGTQGSASRHTCVQPPPGTAAATLDALLAPSTSADTSIPWELPRHVEAPGSTAAARPWWWSAGQLQPYGPGGDLELDSALRDAVVARSWRGELVLVAINTQLTGLASSQLLALEAHGIAHSVSAAFGAFPAFASPKLRTSSASASFRADRMRTDGAFTCTQLAVTLEPQHCAALAASPQRLSCAWTSWQPAADAAAMGTVAQALRQVARRYTARLVGKVNVLVLDADVAVRTSPYPVLEQLPAGQLIHSQRGQTCHDAVMCAAVHSCILSTPHAPCPRALVHLANLLSAGADPRPRGRLSRAQILPRLPSGAALELHSVMRRAVQWR